LPYDISREVEDIEALIQYANEPVFLYGISSGGALALEAANRLTTIKKLAIYEVPFIVDNSRAPVPPDYLERLTKLVESGQRGSAIKLFMRTGVGLPAVLVAMMQVMPGWSRTKSIAHTLINDTTFMVDLQRGQPLPTDRWSSVTMPTLIINGGKSPLWIRNAAKSLANILPNAAYTTLEGQTHIVKPGALAPVLYEFFIS
jgi:pimeloyl-ACP methyl ester carboxylesterase